MSSNIEKNNVSKAEKAKILIKKNIYFVFFIILFILLSFSLYHYGNKYKKAYEDDLGALKKKKNAINRDINKTEIKIKTIKKFKKVWDEEIPGQLKDVLEINKGYINELMKHLEVNNLLSNVKYDVSNPYNYKISEYDHNIKTVLQEIRINFNCLSEHSVYNFIDDFKKFFNGVIILDNVSITSLKNLDKTFVQNMIDGKLDYIFSADITMYLYYIKL